MEDQYFDSVEKYQKSQEERDLLLWHCKAIDQGIENLDARSGERAFWELIQNARDLGGEDCQIKIELDSNGVSFSHKGEPFAFRSLLALVTQNSSKDKPKADVVGRYGTGFMTTHAFNEIVTVSGPFKVMQNKQDIKGYVYFDDLVLNRSLRRDIDAAIEEMGKERGDVHKMHTRQPLYQTFDGMSEEQHWTRFRYALGTEKVSGVSEELDRVERLLPFVMVLNEGIKYVEIHNQNTNKHVRIQRAGKEREAIALNGDKWYFVKQTITIRQLNQGAEELIDICSLQSIEEGRIEDVVILPPYPEQCGNVKDIPSLFLSFPLLGTEAFGVNFIFHSRRFHPVEKRNGIMLPCKAPSDIEREKQDMNVAVLREMMDALLSYYTMPGADSVLTREMSEVRFNMHADDERTAAFNEQMQNQWKEKVVGWHVIPTREGRKAIEDTNVRVLHPDFYKKLPKDKLQEYEPILMSFAQKVNAQNEDPYLLPTEELIEWSKTVNDWGNNNARYCISIDDVCHAIVDRDDDLMKFLRFLDESENKTALDTYALFPNRDGKLCKKGALKRAQFIDDKAYELLHLLLGDNAAEIIDEEYAEIAGVESWTEKKVHDAINTTVDNWRNKCLRASEKEKLTDEQLSALIRFCSATSQESNENIRGRLMQILPKVYGREFVREYLPKLEERGEELYTSAFWMLTEYTLLTIANKEAAWLETNNEMLHAFLQAYMTSTKKEWRDKLNTYAVVPNQRGELCTLGNLHKNSGVPEEMVEIYQKVKGGDLYQIWVDEEFETLFDELEEDKPKAIANEIQIELKEDIKEDKPTIYRDVLMQIILLLNNNDEPEWREWFDDIEAKKHTITFKMQSGPAQKSLFSLMKLDEGVLSELAEYSDKSKIADVLDTYKRKLQAEADKRARMEHLEKIGKHMEEALREELNGELIKIRYTKDEEMEADDEQYGQDIVVKKMVNGIWKPFYYIEVKSKWDFDDPAHMSMRQIKTACENEANYALCCVDLRKYRDSDLATLSTDVIIQQTKVKMDIGERLNEVMQSVLAADKQSDSEQIKLGEYRTNMHVDVFTKGEPFDALIKRISALANE